MSKVHYVYRITNKMLNKHYYGVRGTKLDPKEDLGIKYFSSSRDKEFINDQKNNPFKYKYKIVKKFNNRESAEQFEIKIHNYFNVGINESFYNKITQSQKFKFDMTGFKHSEETKRKIGESNKFLKKGKKLPKEIKIKISESLMGHKQSDETKLKKSQSHTGLKHSEETKKKMSLSAKGKIRPKLKCPHCGKVGGTGNMQRWHFDNCKFKGETS